MTVASLCVVLEGKPFDARVVDGRRGGRGTSGVSLETRGIWLGWQVRDGELLLLRNL